MVCLGVVVLINKLVVIEKIKTFVINLFMKSIIICSGMSTPSALTKGIEIMGIAERISVYKVVFGFHTSNPID